MLQTVCIFDAVQFKCSIVVFKNTVIVENFYKNVKTSLCCCFECNSQFQTIRGTIERGKYPWNSHYFGAGLGVVFHEKLPRFVFFGDLRQTVSAYMRILYAKKD